MQTWVRNLKNLKFSVLWFWCKACLVLLLLIKPDLLHIEGFWRVLGYRTSSTTNPAVSMPMYHKYTSIRSKAKCVAVYIRWRMHGLSDTLGTNRRYRLRPSLPCADYRHSGSCLILLHPTPHKTVSLPLWGGDGFEEQRWREGLTEECSPSHPSTSASKRRRFLIGWSASSDSRDAHVIWH